jgi:hypothetical protein
MRLHEQTISLGLGHGPSLSKVPSLYNIQSLFNSDDNRMKASKAIILYQRDELDQFK